MAYEIPAHVRTHLMDFYAVVGLRFDFIDPEYAQFVFAPDEFSLSNTVIDGEYDEAARNVRDGAIFTMLARLMHDVPFILLCEIRHIYDKGRLKPKRAEFFKNHLGGPGLEWFCIYDKIYKRHETVSPMFVPEPPLNHQHETYLRSYIAGMTATEHTGVPVYRVGEKVFDTKLGTSWDMSYGGKAWLKIAQAFRRLVEARGEREAIEQIDALIALEHNTNTMFNKCAHWVLNGTHEWIKEALDVKFSSSSPLSFLGYCSEQVKRIVMRHRDALAAPPTLEERKRLRIDYSPEKDKSSAALLPPEEVKKILEELYVGDHLSLLHNGIAKPFVVSAIEKITEDSKMIVMKAKGWGESKGYGPDNTPIEVDAFAFSEEDLYGLIVEHTPISAVEKSKRVAENFVRAFYEMTWAVIQKAGVENEIGLGSIQGNATCYRFRLKHSSGKNFRLYFIPKPNGLSIRFSVAAAASNDPESEELCADLTLEQMQAPNGVSACVQNLIPEGVKKLVGH